MSSYEGKAKILTPRSEGEMNVQFKDDATAFNGKKHEVFPGKGALNSEASELLFNYLEERGVKTQHLGRADERTLIARRLTMIPLEAIARFRVAGSLEKRTGLAYGERCEPAVVEFYFKDDSLGDPMLNDDHVELLDLADRDTLATLRALTRSISLELQAVFDRAEIDLFDIKFEFGRDTAGDVVLGDEISPDTCRLRDQNDGAILDKDRFRKDQGDLLEGYRDVVSRLKRVLSEEAS